MKNALLAETHGLKSGFLGDLNGGQESARFDMAKSHRLCFVVDVASLAADLDITLRQHDAAAAGNSKDLQIETAYYRKVAAETAFTKVDISTAAANFVDASFNGAVGMLVIEVQAEDLDDANGYQYVSLQVADPGGARVGSILEVGNHMRNLVAYSEDL